MTMSLVGLRFHMAFDLDRLERYCSMVISRFAQQHHQERFYRFAIDEDLLCLNSVEAHGETAVRYQLAWQESVRPLVSWEEVQADSESQRLIGLLERYQGLDTGDHAACLQAINDERAQKRQEQPVNPYSTPEGLLSLRENTGDWKYQGFATLTDCDGFNWEAVVDHQELDPQSQPHSEYAVAMTQLLARLVESGIFQELNVTEDFSAIRVEHD
ncbi:hypothetical protein [Vibrio nigripulchritudo]|uniref:hypothetical protein n=1 Tax=Vibrio nigripulchritudo TaxID=28173 RepID=UPI002490F1C8|nr:hypothetical protein [Vibrio nigripulchritudo]